MRETLNISLKPEQKRWVKDEMERAGFASASELFRAMIREKQQKQIRAEVEADLLKALDSGKPIEGKTVFRRLRKRNAARRRTRA
jgi:Arc/MetJ-type ribon-helix-helix transcriptional regulator